MCKLCENVQTLQLAEVATQLGEVLFPNVEALAVAREEYKEAKAKVDEALRGKTGEVVREALAADENQPALERVIAAAGALVAAMDNAAGESPAEPVGNC